MSYFDSHEKRNILVTVLDSMPIRVYRQGHLYIEQQAILKVSNDIHLPRTHVCPSFSTINRDYD